VDEVASVARATGLSIEAWKPAIVRGVSYVPRGEPIDDSLAERARDYTHTVKARGGWWSAQFSFAGSQPEVEEWYERGLGRHIEVHDPLGKLIWAGFVDSVDIEVGTLSATAGPLMEAANRVSVAYTPILDTAPHLTGAQTVTVIADDTPSQDRYGILEEVLSGGELLDDGTTDDAAKYRDSYIADHRWPATDERLSTSAKHEAKATLTALGYVHLLQRYIVEQTATGTCSILVKIQDALADDPNGLLSADYTHMDPNAWLVSRNEEKNRNAWAVINEMVNLGDANDAPYTFGVYGDQRFRYKVVGDVPLYQHRLSQTVVRVEDYGRGTPVEPWDVPAGEWVFLPDFLAGRSQPRGVPIRTDHRYVFAEEVTYKAPYEVEIVGGRYAKLAQWLAKKGLSA